MSEYWKSQAKKFCDYCKVWITDNKPSISIHESGRTHQENVQKKLQEIKKQANAKRAEQKKYDSALASIEKAAMEAMQDDLSSNPSLKKQYGTETIKAASSYKPPSPEPKKETVVKVKPKPKPEAETLKRKTEPEPEAKIGKWQKIEEPKPIIENKAPTKPIDLQLPTKGPVVKSAPEVETQEVKEDKPKAKWVSAFQVVDDAPPPEPESAVKAEPTVKEEPVEEKLLEAIEPEPAEVKSKEASDKPAEKIVALKGSKKSSTVFFKKRKNDGQNMRERLDD